MCSCGLEEFVCSQTQETNKIPYDYLSHKEKYERAVENVAVVFKCIHKIYEEMDGSNDAYRDTIVRFLKRTPCNDGSPVAVHILMFLPAILGQASAEQRAQWLPRAINANIIGTFAQDAAAPKPRPARPIDKSRTGLRHAHLVLPFFLNLQTELGHGTFIRGLETTATYDSKTKEFILNTPTLTSSKWWPGGLGHTANYCVVVAQLYINAKHYGIHSFMLQLRDEETHIPLPGVEVGNIGAKFGLNSVDNGFLRLKNVRIPRTHMFMKYAKVLECKDMDSSLLVLEKLKTDPESISRPESEKELDQDPNGKWDWNRGPEVQILDFNTQQHKLLISIATYYAFNSLADELSKVHEEVTLDLQKGSLLRLPELHALACCLKAICSSDTAACVEQCRLACGGHGYMSSSNLPIIYGMATAACTYEGENTVLLLQTARFLVKTWQAAKNREVLMSTVSYFAMFFEFRESFCWENSMDGIMRGFEIVAASHIDKCVKNIEKRMKSGMPYEDAWNLTSIQLVAAAEYTTISKQDIELLNHRYEELLTKIRPNAVGLVDAFDFSDDVLNSTLGAYDGRVYERLMAEALKSPLNAEPVNRTFHTHLKPLMRGKL
ncbi:Probable peroxisomal acyl-coenzyme A oxidase 1 [Eumeta japonica]|uniref:Acyl-coenzyme A oxidase n=1 Tax=Eumeta variegata TaxID=151549 RepID=A0A4C1URC9_EUMVA|nr:Probable peroxisomal acyl-coenzyme A oxidase 1 [Eumeta japonica]